MTSASLTTKDDIINGAGEKLSELLLQKAAALPKNFDQTRFLQNCLTICQDVKNIEKCQPISVARALIKGAFLDLDFFLKEAYIIVYNNPATQIPEANFQTDYKGEIKLCHRYAQRPLVDLYSKIVRKGDVFESGAKDGKPFVNFTPLPFNDDEIVGAFAVAKFENGSMLYEAMSKKQMEKVRDNYAKKTSEGKFGPSWYKSEDEMFRKIPLRRVTKLIDKKFDNHEQEEAYAEEIIDIPAETASTSTAPVALLDAQQAEDKKLFDEFRAKYPTEEDWKIHARVKEAKEAKAEQ